VVPTTIAPRYNPDKGGIGSPAGTTSKYIQTAPYTIEFRCRVEKANISRVSSTSHPIQIDLSQENVYVIEFAQQNTHLDRDILLDIELASNHSNTIVAVEQGAVMASFIPTKEDCQCAMNNMKTTNEFMFVIDCSGSMKDDNKIGLVRQAMLLFLKSLPMNCHFNIIRFGTNYETLFKEITAVYNEQNAQKAEKLINNLQADLGGTELLRPLQWLEQYSPEEGRARQIFLLTDGEISNVNEVLDLCRSMATSTRIFSFGLGYSPSRSLVKGLARATNGCFVFIPPKTSVDVYVGEQLQKALQLSITNVQVEWNLGSNIMSAPTKIPPIYANDRLIVYALTNDPMILFNHDSNVKLHTDKNPIGEAKIDCIPNVSTDGTIARLAAKALILELQHSKLSSSMKQNNSGSLQSRFQEYNPSLTPATTIDEKEIIKKSIIELSLKYQILSPYTAFIGVEKRDLCDELCESTVSMDVCSAIAAPLVPTDELESLSVQELQELEQELQELEAAEFGMQCSLPSLPKSSCDFPTNTSPEQFSNAKSEYETWPTGDQNIVRYLINKQKFDGLWDLDESDLQHLAGKSWKNVSSSYDKQVLISAIVIVIFETRFAAMLTMWHGVVEKARQRLLDLLGNDAKQLESLLKDIRQHCESYFRLLELEHWAS
ncbi:unnamed protein product, partial [Rotaria sp. Silwood1]